MDVRALRGVCIGVDRHLVAGDIVDLDPALTTYLVGIGAVEVVTDDPDQNQATLDTNLTPVKAGKKEK
jgi:hypothetical protein